jgi:hypothetical protein
MRKFTSLATATAIVLTSVAAAPAEARGRYGHGGWGHRDRDNVSAGEVIGGLLILGTIAAVVGAASKDKAQRRDRDDRYEPPYREQRQDAPNYEPQVDDRAEPYGNGGTEVRPYGNGEAEARASDACSWAVEAEMGDDARVDSITGTEPNNGGWYVTGTASRLGGEVKSFGCSYKSGRVIDVRFG